MARSIVDHGVEIEIGDAVTGLRNTICTLLTTFLQRGLTERWNLDTAVKMEAGSDCSYCSDGRRLTVSRSTTL